MPEHGDEPPEIEPVQLPEPPDWNWEREADQSKDGRPSTRSKEETFSRGMGLAFAIGTCFLGPVLAGLLIGYLIDGRVGGTAGIVGLLLGTTLAFVLLIRLVNKLNQDG